MFSCEIFPKYLIDAEAIWSTLQQLFWTLTIEPLQWHHKDHDSISNHQPHGCLLNLLLRHRSKKTSKLRVTGLVWGIHRNRGIPRTKGQLREKCFHLMTSSWFVRIPIDPNWNRVWWRHTCSSKAQYFTKPYNVQIRPSHQIHVWST